MGEFISTDDLAPFADIDAVKAAAMITDAEAMAVLAAPCLPALLTAAPDETEKQKAVREAKLAALVAILRGAIVRWNEAGTGAFSSVQQIVGPFGKTESVDTRQQRRSMFWPSEIEQLQSLCATGAEGRAFSVDTVPAGWSPLHSETCSLRWGARCSCGAVIAGRPIFEGGDW